MIQIKKVSKQFGNLEALREVDLSCDAGQCIALIGPNGCGKTTLIKSILGMTIPGSGTILFDGKDIRDDEQYRRKIGYMPQIGRYPSNMSIGQVIEMIRDIRSSDDRLDEDLIKAFGLKDLLHKQMGTLSGGTTQKVSASLAFLFSPDALILDEPTAGLDPVSSEMLKEKIIHQHRQGKLVIITSHLLSELDELVTHVVMMQEGRLLFHLPTEALKEKTHSPNLAKAITYILKRGNVQ